MATESTFVWDQTFTAYSDFSTATTWINAASTVYMAAFGGQYMIVSSAALVGNNPSVTFCVTSTGTGTTCPIGVIQNNPTSGHAAIVRLMGRSKALASSSGTIAYGDWVTATTWGSLVSVTTTGYRVLGIARSASTGASGQLIEVDLTGGFPCLL